MLRSRVARHYDELSPYYRDLWGEHIHHGYYARGDESRREATEALIDLLADALGIETGATVLDVGCGVGGTSRYLARRRGCRVVGITLSAVQAQMARDGGRPQYEVDGFPRPEPHFVVGDAAALPFRGTFDRLLAMEVLSHVEDRGAFFDDASRLLPPGGRVGIAAWLKADDRPAEIVDAHVEPIERGMLVKLPNRQEYESNMARSGFDLILYRDISSEVARTWDLCLEIIDRNTLWSLAAMKGRDVLEFLRSFRAMRRGFASGTFRYALLVAEKR
ncbi:MAG: class I SAM-dependent methyltransferase [Acidobacteriota bacterium]|jgi:tocopherol O-methyltransferase